MQAIPTPPKPKEIKANIHLLSKARNILQHSAPSNDAESQALIQMFDFTAVAGSPEICAVANYMAEAVVYNRVNHKHLYDAKNYRRNHNV